MKKIVLNLILTLLLTNVQAQQCDSNPVLLSGSGGTVYFADSSFVSPGWSTNYSASYLWDFRDGFTSTQKNPCHTFGDFSNLTSSYVKLTVTFIDMATGNSCQDVDSVFILFFINPCVYGDLNISASGNILTANQTYSVSVCSNVYPNSFLWSTGDTTQSINAPNSGTYTCTVTTNAGCVYTASYNFNGSLTPTFDCSQMDIFESNNDYNLVSFQSMYINNNTFPELIDSLSYWDIFDESGINIGLYPMMWQGSPANFSVQNIGFNGLPSDCLYVCYNAYLYDSLYQHNIWASPPQGSICSSCKWLSWNGSIWTTNLAPPPAPVALCDSINISIVSSSFDSITLGTNLNNLGFTGTAFYNWTEWVISPFPTGSTGVIDTNPSPTFSINIGDTSIFILQLTTIDNGISSSCLIPTLVYNSGGSWIAFKTSPPTTTGLEPVIQNTQNRKILKIIDSLGKETSISKNKVLYYIYNDGTTEKRIVLD